ncbi:MAG: (2Fe-2S)-binding protein [Bacteroidetes bacterium]|nr:MAG: (2Fe-2S)-binding protein [Bacteroidota bacterium]
MRIDRCLCFQKTFAELREVAEATGARDVAALQTHVAFGHNCRLCHPYVRRMLRTGQTVFHEVITDSEEPAPQ